MLDKPLLYLKLIGLTLSLSLEQLTRILSSKVHLRSYRAVPEPKNVVVIGGSFAGFFLAKQLSESLPTGYRVILIEKHSHYHFTWNFPRITVVEGHDKKAFVPYPRKPLKAPEGIYMFQQGTVVSIDEHKVTLQDGSQIEYEYLAIATGSQARYPVQLDDAVGRDECIEYFATQQERIKTARNIVVVGGGAAGVEVAGDIRSKYPDKKLTLVHSRDHLLNKFGAGLHELAKKDLEALGVKLHLGERVVAGLDTETDKDADTDTPKEVTLRSGTVLECDLLIKCTGQSARTQLLKDFSPSSISPSSGGILIEKTLQVKNAPSPKIFALGDVIDLPGPKMGRGASMQGFLVADNIVRAIKGRSLKAYTPSMIDRSIELTLGVGKNVTYITDGKREVMFPHQMADEAMHAARAWTAMDATPFDDPADAVDKVAVV